MSPKISSVEKFLVLTATTIADGAKFILGFIPIIDLIGLFMWFMGYISLNLYFFLKMGPKFLGGRRSGQKMATTLLNGLIGATPVFGDFVPELTIQAATMFWILDKELKEEAEEAAKKSAANDNTSPKKLSRAA